MIAIVSEESQSLHGIQRKLKYLDVQNNDED